MKIKLLEFISKLSKQNKNTLFDVLVHNRFLELRDTKTRVKLNHFDLYVCHLKKLEVHLTSARYYNDKLTHNSKLTIDSYNGDLCVLTSREGEYLFDIPLSELYRK